jgi:antibiotic biosynthesis monooxygenase (ABM) superfamily enzyme
MKENPLTMEMLLQQLVGLNIIQVAAIPMISLVLLEWVLTIVKKKTTMTV